MEKLGALCWVEMAEKTELQGGTAPAMPRPLDASFVNLSKCCKSHEGTDDQA